MKGIVQKRWIGLIVLGVLLFFGSCGMGKPTLVAKKYFAALEEGNWEEARNYVAISSFNLFEEWRPYLKEGNEYEITGYEIVDESHAIVTYMENSDPVPKQLKLKKERGNWRVQLGDK